MKKERIIYLDYLKIIAFFLVVQVHVSAQFLEKFDLNTPSFAISLGCDFLGLIGVPLFVMISGALTMSPSYQTPLKSILIKKTLHYFLIYYIWKAFYQFYSLLCSDTPLNASTIKTDVILALIQKSGYYHLWYLPMIAIIFMVYPIIKKGLEDNKTLCIYFVSVFFVVYVLFPTIFNYDFKFKYLFMDFFNQNSFYMFSGYLGYFVLGHLLNFWYDKRGKAQNIVLFAVIIASLIVATYLGVNSSIYNGEPSYIMNTPFSIPSFLVVTALFLLTKSITRQDAKSREYIFKISNTTFGIYLLHPLIIDLLSTQSINYGAKLPLISIPFITLLIFIICHIVARIILYIPILKRLMR